MDLPLKGRGAQEVLANKFQKSFLSFSEVEGVDEAYLSDKIRTQIFEDHSNTFVNKVNSPDLGFMYSANPYQGCEHGCAYCYARNSHNYWGFDAGLDFESKIIIKRNAVKLLENFLLKSPAIVNPISFSGNTDCYQPLEKKFQLTRNCLKLLLDYRYPVSIITKNSLILRDLAQTTTFG